MVTEKGHPNWVTGAEKVTVQKAAAGLGHGAASTLGVVRAEAAGG